jgi:twitching motility protein PilT
MVREELDMYPGSQAGTDLLKRQYITPEQLLDLKAKDAPGAGSAGRSSLRLRAAGIRRRSTEGGVSQVSLSAVIPGKRGISDYLAFARGRGCSDLHICIGRPPFVRLHGEIHYLKEDVITPEASEELNFSILDGDQREHLEAAQQIDFSLDLPGDGRYRCNIYRQRLGWDGVYRIIRTRVPTLDELGMPPVLKQLTEHREGLIIVAGSIGSGKNTTVAAMLEHINGLRNDHIVTVEDPVEYVLEPKRCQITQREMGSHSRSFAVALRAALRQDPDVISVGEMRDLESVSIAITAAETGHLVFGTLHTNSATRSVARIMNVYPPLQRAQVGVMVAETMRGVIAQQLIPRRDGNGVAVALEILVFSPGIAQAIKDGKMHQLYTLMQAGKKQGMRTMDDSLMELVQKGIISGNRAYTNAENKTLFEAAREHR